MQRSTFKSLFKKNGQEIFDLVLNKKGHVHICGDIKIGADVRNNLEYVLIKLEKIFDSMRTILESPQLFYKKIFCTNHLYFN